MVLLAASICTRGGKPVLSRQFREMPRSRIEGLLASFPKLISTGQQHTTIETEAVRYVYQPLEDLYMILITNKNSNILQDIETLHLFARVVSDICRSLDERDILRNSFELLGAFDEIVSLGYRENVNLMQIRSILEMESHEEKIQEIIERNKEMEAKEELKRRAKQLEMQRREAARRGQMASQYGGAATAGGYQSVPRQTFEPPPVPVQVHKDTFNGSTPAARPFKGKGMQLGKKSKNADLLGAMGTEVGNFSDEVTSSAQPLLSQAQAAAIEPTVTSTQAANPLSLLPEVGQESVHVLVKERISMEANRDGGLEFLEVKGDLELKISDPALAKLRLKLQPPSSSPLLGAGDLQYKTHPHVDKKAWASDRTIALKDTSRPFPVSQALGVLRWRMVTKDETAIPLSINCWPSPSADGGCEVNIEYELEAEHLELRNVVISIPLPDGAYPSVELAEGSWAVNPSTNTLEWTLDNINLDNRSGSLEFSVASGADDTSAFFPVSVDFVSEKTYCEVSVADIFQIESNESTTFSQQTVLSTENYLIA